MKIRLNTNSDHSYVKDDGQWSLHFQDSRLRFCNQFEAEKLNVIELLVNSLKKIKELAIGGNFQNRIEQEVDIAISQFTF